MNFLKRFEASPKRGFATSRRLRHWRPLLEEWCLVHERFCRLVKGDSIFWYGERANLGALAAAAWRIEWAAVEEFDHEREFTEYSPGDLFNEEETIKSRSRGRADLFLKSLASEEYVEAKLVWCGDSDSKPAGRVVEGIRSACNDAQSIPLEEGSRSKRVGVVFAVPSRRWGDSRSLPRRLTKLAAAVDKLGLDAAAWCLPDLPAELEDGGLEYLGVILLAKLIS